MQKQYYHLEKTDQDICQYEYLKKQKKSVYFMLIIKLNTKEDFYVLFCACHCSWFSYLICLNHQQAYLFFIKKPRMISLIDSCVDNEGYNEVCNEDVVEEVLKCYFDENELLVVWSHYRSENILTFFDDLAPSQ